MFLRGLSGSTRGVNIVVLLFSLLVGLLIYSYITTETAHNNNLLHTGESPLQDSEHLVPIANTRLRQGAESTKTLRTNNLLHTGESPLQDSEHLVPIANTSLRQGAESTKSLRTNQNETHGCEIWFEGSFEENLEHISNYPGGVYNDYKAKLNGQLSRPNRKKTSFPVIVTAASESFYLTAQGLLKSIHELLLPKYKNITIIFYDLGLSGPQYTELMKYCKCEVRKFPFDEFPQHIRRLGTYTWKPLIVKMLLMEFEWVWWMDSSVRFVANDLDLALSYSKDNSVLFFTYGLTLSIARQTDTRTMEYLREDVCKFRHFGETEATFLLFHFDRITNIIIDQWASCAINKACMAPDGARLSCIMSDHSDGRCHRYDQSMIGILLRRLWHAQNDYPLVEQPFHIHVINRGQAVFYFETLAESLK